MGFSSHTDCIVAEDEKVVERFLGAVDRWANGREGNKKRMLEG